MLRGIHWLETLAGTTIIIQVIFINAVAGNESLINSWLVQSLDEETGLLIERVSGYVAE